MKRDRLAFTLVTTLALAGPSCGGKAIVDPGVSGGGSGGSSTSSSGSGGSSTSTSTSGTGGTGGMTIAQACAEVCDIFSQCGQTEPGCASACQAGANAECADEYLAFLQCLATFMSPPDCDPPQQCDAAMEAYISCDGPEPPPPCEPGPCYTGSDGSCGCEAVCGGDVFATDCSPSGGPELLCTCSINELPVASCSHPMGMEACDVFTGCCAPFFFDWN